MSYFRANVWSQGSTFTMKVGTYSNQHAVALPDGSAASEEGDEEDDASHYHGRDGSYLYVVVCYLHDVCGLQLHRYAQAEERQTSQLKDLYVHCYKISGNNGLKF